MAVIASTRDARVRIDPGMHTALIRRIAVSADGGLLATASHDKTVRLWDIDGGPQPVATLRRTLRPAIGPSDDGKVDAVALAPDGSWCAAGGWFTSTGDEFISIFDTASGEIATRIGPLSWVVHEIEVSADRLCLAAGLGGKGGIRAWRRENEGWHPWFADTDYAGDADGLVFAADGRLFATSDDGYLRAYAPDGRRLHKLRAPGGKLPLGIAVSPDGAKLAVGYQHAMRVDVLDAATMRLAFSADTRGLEGGHLAVVAWRADGALAAAGTHGGASSPVVVWPDGGRGPRRSLPGPKNTVMDLVPWRGGLALGAFDPAFGLIAGDETSRVFTPPPMADFRGKRFKNFLVSADGRRVRFGLGPFGSAPHLFDVGALTLSPSPVSPTDLLAADTVSLPIEGWHESYRPNIGNWRIGLKDREMSHSLAILPRRTGFLLGTEWRLRRYDANGRHVWRRPAPGPARCVNIAREGRLVIAAYGDGSIRWHRASDGGVLLSLFIHTAWPGYPEPGEPLVTGWILWTPDGSYACSDGADDLIGWHVNRGDAEAAGFHPASRYADEAKRPDRIRAALDTI